MRFRNVRIGLLVLFIFSVLSTGRVHASTGNIFCPGGKEISTALGCVDPSPSGMFTTIFTTGIGLAGGIAFLLILFGGFQILTSSGNPEQLTGGKELISSAITGLLMIISAIFLLKIIGVNILCIPGFGPC